MHWPWGSDGGPLPDRLDDIGDGGDSTRAAVDLEQTGGVGQQVDVGVVKAGDKRHALAVDALDTCSRQVAQPLTGAYRGDAVAFDGHVPACGPPAVHGQDSCVFQNEVCQRNTLLGQDEKPIW